MTMQDTLTNQELAAIDLSKVAALQQKRTLAFVNHFMITTVQFLNSFLKKSEKKLMEFERKLEKVEAAIVLLEARLSSIPEVNTPAENQSEGAALSEAPVQPTDQTDNSPTNQPESQPEESLQKVQNASEPSHPEYDRFLKMVQVGVPLEAVKLKLSLEGLDPNILVKLLGNK